MRTERVSDHVWWVGAIDWNLRDFHGFETPRGTTYNAYLVKGEHTTALVDTVKTPFVGELLSRVASLVDPASIGLIVVNHVEPDHNMGLPDVMAACPNARVVASGSGVRGVAEYHDGLVVEAVGDKDVIDLGGVTLRFLPMPMVHWPDSMFTYCSEERVLMCNDAFGQHLATADRFADEVGQGLALDELGRYYANILMPVSAQVSKVVDKVHAAGWEPVVVAPSHGVMWRGETVSRAIERYAVWSTGPLKDEVVIAYSTMWGSTDALARAIGDGVASTGTGVVVHDLAVSPFAEVTYELLERRGLLIGSPTLHHGMLYRVAAYLQWLSGLRPAGRSGAAFGSFGWSSGATAQIEGRMTDIGIAVTQAAYTQKFRPTTDELDAARDWGVSFARSLGDSVTPD